MEIEELKEVKGEWRLFINGMQKNSNKENYNYNEVIEFINNEDAKIIKTSCEYIIRFHKLTTEFEFRNNHWARENNYA